MSIAIKCPGCGKDYNVKEDLAGKRVKCKCGQAMKVPAAVDASDPMGSLLDEALPPTEATKPGGPRRAPAAKPAETSAPVKTKKKAKKKSDDMSPVGVALVGVGMVAVLLAGVGVAAFFLMRSYRPGSASPEEAFKARKEAVDRDDSRMIARVYSPGAHAALANVMLAFATESRKDGSLAESSTFIKEVLDNHGVAGMLGGEDESDAAAGRKKAVAAIKNKSAFCRDYWMAIKEERNKTLPRDPVKQGLARRIEENLREYLLLGSLSDVKIDGDTATGKMSYRLADETDPMVSPVAFKKCPGGWLLHFNSVEEVESSPWLPLVSGRAKLDFSNPIIDMLQGP